MLLRVVLGFALVADMCKAAPSKSAAEELTICRAGDTKKKGCNDCFCLAGHWSCSFKACFSNEEFVPGSFLCKLAPNVRGCHAVEKPDNSETQAKPGKGQHHMSTTRPSTAITFPTAVDPEPPKRLCPPGPVKEHRNPNSPNRPGPVEKDTAPDHQGGEQREFDIDIRGGPRPPAEDALQPAGDGERPTRCRSRPALASGSSSSGVSVSGSGPVRRAKPRPGNRPTHRPETKPGNRPTRRPESKPGNRATHRPKPTPANRPTRRPVPSGDRRTPSGDPQKQWLPDQPSRPRPESEVHRRPRPRTLGSWWIPE